MLSAPAVRGFFADFVARLNEKATGGATFIARMRLLAVPPSLDLGEVTDKGSINQRAVLHHRAALVDAMYAQGSERPDVIYARGNARQGTIVGK